MVQQKFEIGQHVYKWTGDYRGPGIVRGIAGLENGKLRYLVSHAIAGGDGELLHVYAEGNLREPTRYEELSTMVRQRDAAEQASDNELLDALVEAHRQVDGLLTQFIMLDDGFKPSKSPLWPEIVRRAELIQKHGGKP